MLKALASGMTARTVVASVSRSAELRGTSSTEILIWGRMVPQRHFHSSESFEAPKSLRVGFVCLSTFQSSITAESLIQNRCVE